MIKKYGLQFPWVPILVIIILHLSIWKLINFELKTKLPVLPKYNNELSDFVNSTTNIPNISQHMKDRT